MTSWREIIEPRAEVKAGEYTEAEFAADLAAVAKNKSKVPAYSDATEFFAHTFMTDGLKDVLRLALKRIITGKGQRVVQLKTSFGGGKTHTLLALYHLFGGRFTSIPKPIKFLMNDFEIEVLPKVCTAVVVGTENNYSVNAVERGGWQIKTLWGDIASQLAIAAGNLNLYDKVAKADAAGKSPGTGVLVELFDACGACLILLDELISYGVKIYGTPQFRQFKNFMQELTQAVARSEKTLLVVSLSISETHEDDAAAVAVTEIVDEYLRGMDYKWSPVTAEESYQIVRRRLFDKCKDESARKKICAKFSEMYRQHENLFPSETKLPEYRDRLESCFPIHPELFDYLYHRWAGIKGFQSTRGVLKLMANVVKHLWNYGDAGSFIMPASVMLEKTDTRDELTGYLKGKWATVYDSDIAGVNSESAKIDKRQARYEKLKAATKVARAIFLGSAPSTAGQSARGINEAHIRLAIMQPEDVVDEKIYKEALNDLQENSSYMHMEDSRYWYDERPTVENLVRNIKAYTIKAETVDAELDRRIFSLARDCTLKNIFKGVKVFKATADVPDKEFLQLVILAPDFAHRQGDSDSAAMKAFKACYENCGKAPRFNKNMLIFLAPEAEEIAGLKNLVSFYAAWQYIDKHRNDYRFDKIQLEEIHKKIGKHDAAIDKRIGEIYCYLTAPKVEPENLRDVRFELQRINHKPDITAVDWETIRQHLEVYGGIIDELEGKYLDEHYLQKYFWKNQDSVSVSELWKLFTMQCYMPRLVDFSVLIKGLNDGVSKKIFALADSFDGENYTGLTFDGRADLEKIIVKGEVAAKILTPPEPIEPSPVETETVKPADESPPKNDLPTQCHLQIKLNQKISKKKFLRYYEDILAHLMNLPDAEVEINLSASFTLPSVIDKEISGIVKTNCEALSVDFEFE